MDAAPKVVALNTELGTAEAGLKTEQGILEAARGAKKDIEVAVKASNSVLTALKVNNLSAAGSLKGITTGCR